MVKPRARGESHLYFAYGSNLFVPQMASLAPDAVPVGLARLEGHELFLNVHGVLSVRSNVDTTVLGLLWSCTDADLKSLDRFEAVDAGLYVREVFSVETIGELSDHETVDSFVYRSVSTQTGKPRPGYLEIAVLSAMRTLGFPPAYVALVEGFLNNGTAGDPWQSVPASDAVFTT